MRFLINKCIHPVLNGGLIVLIKVLDLSEKGISASFLNDPRRGVRLSLLRRLLSLQGRLIDLFCGSTMKNRVRRLYLGVCKLRSDVHLQYWILLGENLDKDFHYLLR